MRAPRKQAGKAEQKTPSKTRYFLTDPDTKSLGNIDITAEHHKTGVDLTDEEAAMFVASGSITTTAPEGDRAARKAVARQASAE